MPSSRRVPQKIDVRPPMSQLPPMVGVTIGAVVAYLFAESAFASRVHPIHWLVAIVGGLVGLALGIVVAWAMNR